MNASSADPLRSLFDTALDLLPAERIAYLQAHCSDPALRTRVLALLDADSQTSNSLHHDWAGHIAQGLGEDDASAHAAPALPPDGRIGPFHILRVIGTGGFSTVFEAQRDVEGVAQHVALKLLHCGLHSTDARRRFAHERRALLQLKHPNICRLIDAGVTDTGQPYIALELIDGMPITDHAREHRLDFSKRLTLFTDVCRAVDAAHRALIVHRDIKPSNVLVSTDGTVSLLDFGIAKLLDDPDESRTFTPAFTPAYAAPEQQTGGGIITTATDVYALGILLDELITGERRAPGETRTPSARVTDTIKPGALPATPQAMRKLLRGDLDNIVLKAIAEEPERRYASASALAEDIQRHLANQPVLAHPPSNWYRTRKFITRHRGGVVSTVAFLLAIFAALGVALWQTQVARDEVQRANAMRDFMFDAFGEAQPGAPRDGPPRITEVVEQAIANSRADTQMNPRVRAELLTELGSVLMRQGDVPRAREVLQWNHDKARAQFGDDAHETLESGYYLAEAMIRDGDYAAARALLDQLLAHAQDADLKLGANLRLISAVLAARQREFTRATADAEEGMRQIRRLGDVAALTHALDEYGNVRFTIDDSDGAIAAWEEALALRQQRFGPVYITVATSHASLSRAYRRLGKLDEAQRHIQAALAIDDAVLPAEHWHRTNHLNALMMVQIGQRDFQGALKSASESLRIHRVLFGDGDHPELAGDLNSIGMMYIKLEDFPAAIAPLRESLERYITRYGAERVETAVMRANYGLALAGIGDIAGSEAAIRHAITLFEQAIRQNGDEQAASWEKLARIRLDRGDIPAALEAIDHIDALLAKLNAPDAYWDGRAETLRASALFALGRAAEARPLLDAAITALATSKNPDPVVRVEAALLDANARLALGEYDVPSSTAARDALASLRHPPRRLVVLAQTLGEQSK